MAKRPEQSNQQSAASKIPSGLTPNSRLFLAFLVVFAVATLIFNGGSGSYSGTVTREVIARYLELQAEYAAEEAN